MYGSKAALQRHARSKHGECLAKEGRYECPVKGCNKKMYREGLFVRHLEKFHEVHAGPYTLIYYSRFCLPGFTIGLKEKSISSRPHFLEWKEETESELHSTYVRQSGVCKRESGQFVHVYTSRIKYRHLQTVYSFDFLLCLLPRW